MKTNSQLSSTKQSKKNKIKSRKPSKVHAKQQPELTTHIHTHKQQYIYPQQLYTTKKLPLDFARIILRRASFESTSTYILDSRSRCKRKKKKNIREEFSAKEDIQMLSSIYTRALMVQSTRLSTKCIQSRTCAVHTTYPQPDVRDSKSTSLYICIQLIAICTFRWQVSESQSCSSTVSLSYIYIWYERGVLLLLLLCEFFFYFFFQFVF